jgi:hypothetical protein
MHFPTLLTSLALLSTAAFAAPLEARNSRLVLIFQGATPEASYTVEPPSDGTLFAICKFSSPPFSTSFAKVYVNVSADHPEISVSHITLYGAGQCTIDGVDGSRTTVRISQTVDVGPPQVQERTGGR